MFCAISGNVPTHPVVATTTGLVYERSTITAALASGNGLCPVTSTPVDPQTDLIDVKSTTVAQPRSIETTSVPELLNLLASEYDALVLENFSHRRKTKATTDELSKVLYKLDAATRVVARLEKERDEARKALTSFSPTAAEATSKKRAAPSADADSNAQTKKSKSSPEEPNAALADVKKFGKASTKFRKKRKLAAARAAFEGVTERQRVKCTKATSASSSSKGVLVGTSKGVELLTSKDLELVSERRNVSLLHSVGDATRILVSSDSPNDVLLADDSTLPGVEAAVVGVAAHPLEKHLCGRDVERREPLPRRGQGGVDHGRPRAYGPRRPPSGRRALRDRCRRRRCRR